MGCIGAALYRCAGAVAGAPLRLRPPTPSRSSRSAGWSSPPKRGRSAMLAVRARRSCILPSTSGLKSGSAISCRSVSAGTSQQLASAPRPPRRRCARCRSAPRSRRRRRRRPWSRATGTRPRRWCARHQAAAQDEVRAVARLAGAGDGRAGLRVTTRPVGRARRGRAAACRPAPGCTDQRLDVVDRRRPPDADRGAAAAPRSRAMVRRHSAAGWPMPGSTAPTKAAPIRTTELTANRSSHVDDVRQPGQPHADAGRRRRGPRSRC